VLRLHWNHQTTEHLHDPCIECAYFQGISLFIIDADIVNQRVPQRLIQANDDDLRQLEALE
jgi:hypothetical protein